MKAIITDFSRVLLSPIDNEYKGGLNPLYEENKDKQNFNFWKFFKLNKELLDYYHNLSEKIPVYIFTTGYIQEFPELNEMLKQNVNDIFSAARLNIKKSDTNSYLKVLELIGAEPDEAVYIDDKETNVDVAKKIGLNCFIYKNNKQLINEIEKINEK